MTKKLPVALVKAVTTKQDDEAAEAIRSTPRASNSSINH